MTLETTDARDPGEATDVRESGKGSAGGATARDPVCGMTVAPEKAAARVEFEGRAYVFCGEACARRFRNDPEQYLDAAGDPSRGRDEGEEENRGDGKDGDAAEGEAERYLCPMHPEVTRDAPGSCPKCGMDLEPAETGVAGEEDEEARHLRALLLRFAVAGALTVLIFLLSWVPRLVLPDLPRAYAAEALRWTRFVLAAPVVLWAGWLFFRRGWASLLNRSPNMFTLIMLGVGAAFGYSTVALLAPGLFPEAIRDAAGRVPLYFEPAAMITALVLLGQVLEARARARTGAAIRELLDLTPPTARRVGSESGDGDGGEEEIPLDAVRVGDHLRIKPGETIPVDGVVLEGETTVDESMISGEAEPVTKRSGDTLTGGTVNRHGGVRMRAEKVGDDTLLARIVEMVREAQRSKAPIQRLADRVAAYFVPAVMAVSLLTLVVWILVGPRLELAFLNAIAVLLIACPCALGLATPMSIMVGTGRGAREGVLIRDAEALETLEKVTVLLVDKTGTLTEGRPRLTETRPTGEADEATLLRLAAAVEAGSEHPIAVAVRAGAESAGVDVPKARDFQAVAGKGVRARIEEALVRVGSASWLEAEGVALDAVAEEASALREKARTVLYVARDDRLLGILGVADPIKEEAPEAVRDLRADGLRVILLTGDNEATARAVAEALEIEEVHAEALPEDKENLVKRLRGAGERVAMAGDGINDAAALARADVGIAMGTGTDIAMESAGVTLVEGEIGGIARARRLSRAVVRNIKQNLFFAFVYNGLGVPVAAGVLYPFFGILLSPVIGSAAMSLSSLSVIGNALRLRLSP